MRMMQVYADTIDFVKDIVELKKEEKVQIEELVEEAVNLKIGEKALAVLESLGTVNQWSSDRKIIGERFSDEHFTIMRYRPLDNLSVFHEAELISSSPVFDRMGSVYLAYRRGPWVAELDKLYKKSQKFKREENQRIQQDITNLLTTLKRTGGSGTRDVSLREAFGLDKKVEQKPKLKST